MSVDTSYGNKNTCCSNDDCNSGNPQAPLCLRHLPILTVNLILMKQCHGDPMLRHGLRLLLSQHHQVKLRLVFVFIAPVLW